MQHVFSIYDDAAKAYMRPFFAISKGIALRSFSDACSNTSDDLFKHPADYTLFYLGTFEETSAVFTLLPTPERLYSALDFIPREKSNG